MNETLSDRQKEIIRVSLELIAESGIQELTIKNLARKIGFSESAIYRHYENKTEILLAILDHFRENSAQFFLSGQKFDTDAITRISRIFRNHFKSFAENPTLAAVIFSEELFRNEPQLVEKVNEIMQHNLTILAGIIETGQQKGELRNDIEALPLSLVVLGTLRVYLKMWHMSGYKPNIVTQGEQIIHTILQLIKK